MRVTLTGAVSPVAELKTDRITDGDIGVFYLDGNAFVKEYNRTDKGVFLISHNEKYKPIPITDNDESRIYGKVVYPR